MNKDLRLEVNEDTLQEQKDVAQLKVPRSSSMEMAMASPVSHSDMTRPLGWSMLSCKFGLVCVLCYAKAYQPHPGQAYTSTNAAGRDSSLLQRSASVRCGAVVIIAHAPSHRNTCETHAYRRRVVYRPPSLRLC
jgi:hypothetical protein